jgi:phage tail-like protein
VSNSFDRIGRKICEKVFPEKASKMERGLIKKDFSQQNFKFLLELQGVIVGGFSAASMLHDEIEFVEEGGIKDRLHKLPKKTKYSSITLKKGVIFSDLLLSWHQDIVAGKINRKSGCIIGIDSEGNERCRWYVVTWSGPKPKLKDKIIIVENLELLHNGLEKS